MGNSPSIAGHKWAALPVMTEKKVRVRVMVEVFWAGMEVINNCWN